MTVIDPACTEDRAGEESCDAGFFFIAECFKKRKGEKRKERYTFKENSKWGDGGENRDK